jgi:hypothetical protein
LLALLVAAASAPATITVEGWPVRRLSQAEQEERRCLGLCYNCDKKFGRGHNRVCKCLFLLSMALWRTRRMFRSRPRQAPMRRSPTSPSMQIRVVLGGTSLVALLDSGSTHNFISEAAVQRTGLPLQHRPQLTATVANDKRVSCLGIIRQVAFTVDGDTFSADLFILPLAGHDVVLGTQ